MNFSRVLIIITTLHALGCSAALVITLKRIRTHFFSTSWFLIISGFVCALANNLIISYLVFFRPSGLIAIILIDIYFILNSIKNTFWVAGFIKLNKDWKAMEKVVEL